MKILIDTNVLIDYVTSREPYTNTANAIMDQCINERMEGYIAVHSILNMFYILRKVLPDTAERKKQLADLTEFLDMVEIDSGMMIRALNNEYFTDFEDCIQSECAVKIRADYIITRNEKDFIHSKVRAISPEKFLGVVKEMA